jgi:uncharacterized membrane protein
VIKNPIRLLQHVLSDPSIHYLRQLFGPLAFLPLLSPHLLAIAAPEFGINLLSESGNMRNIYFHYTAVLTPFIFISTLFGFQLIRDVLKKKVKSHLVLGGLSLLLTAGMLNAVFSYGPLPFAGNQQTYMFTSTPSQKEAVYSWVKKLENDSIKVASTGKYAPFFTSRRFFYDMSQYYTYADYVVVNPDEALNGWGKERAAPGYKDLIIDPDYEKVYDEEYLEVYKRK